MAGEFVGCCVRMKPRGQPMLQCLWGWTGPGVQEGTYHSPSGCPAAGALLELWTEVALGVMAALGCPGQPLSLVSPSAFSKWLPGEGTSAPRTAPGEDADAPAFLAL